MVVLEKDGAATRADDPEAERLRPLRELEDGAWLVAGGERVDDTGTPRSLGEDWPHDHVRLHVEHHHVQAVLDCVRRHPRPHFRQPGRLHQGVQLQLRQEACVGGGDWPPTTQGILGRAQPVGDHRLGAVLAQAGLGASDVHVGGRHHPHPRHRGHLVDHAPAHASNPDHANADRFGAAAQLIQVHERPAIWPSAKMGFSGGPAFNK